MRTQKALLTNGVVLATVDGFGHWPRGTYFVKVTMGGQVFTQKMVLVR